MGAVGIELWAEHPEVTSAQLKSALATIRQDESLYESASNILKAEYLFGQKSLTSGEWRESLSPSQESKSGWMRETWNFGAWVIGEPDLTRRLYRQVIANHLQEIDKPISRRSELFEFADLSLFDRAPSVPLRPGQMRPHEIDLQSTHSCHEKH